MPDIVRTRVILFIAVPFFVTLKGGVFFVRPAKHAIPASPTTQHALVTWMIDGRKDNHLIAFRVTVDHPFGQV
jgi:hypothetical protein